MYFNCVFSKHEMNAKSLHGFQTEWKVDEKSLELSTETSFRNALMRVWRH